MYSKHVVRSRSAALNLVGHVRLRMLVLLTLHRAVDSGEVQAVGETHSPVGSPGACSAGKV